MDRQAVRFLFSATVLVFLAGCMAIKENGATGMRDPAVGREARRIAGPNLPPTARTLESFRGISQSMTLPQIFRLVGSPDQDAGSDGRSYIYHLKDNSKVTIEAHDERVAFVRQFQRYETHLLRNKPVYLVGFKKD